MLIKELPNVSWAISYCSVSDKALFYLLGESELVTVVGTGLLFCSIFAFRTVCFSLQRWNEEGHLVALLVLKVFFQSMLQILIQQSGAFALLILNIAVQHQVFFLQSVGLMLLTLSNCSPESRPVV